MILKYHHYEEVAAEDYLSCGYFGIIELVYTVSL